MDTDDIRRSKRAIRGIALARFVSNLGGGAASVVLPFDIYRLTGSVFWLSGTFIVIFAVRGIASLAAGSIADRFDRRRVMIASDVLAALSWAAIASVNAPVSLLVLAFVAVVVSTPNWFAAQAILPSVASGDDLTRANALISAANSVSGIAGPAVGGVLVAVLSPSWVYALDAVSFALSAALIAVLVRPTRQDEDVEPETEDVGGTIRDAFAVLWRDTTLRRLLVAWTIMSAGLDMAFVADLPLVRLFGVGAVGYGILNSVAAAGSLAGAWLARRFGAAGETRAVALGAAGAAAGYALVAVSPWFALVLAAVLLAMLFDTAGEIGGDGLLQRRSPDRLRGRVFAALAVVTFGASALGFAVAAPLIEAFGPRGVYAAGALCSLAALGVVATFLRDRWAEAV